jgi:uncharacterized protein (DUF983 family)
VRKRQPRCEPSRLEALCILGLGPEASQRQVKRAYRRLALRYHPDRVGGQVPAAVRTEGSSRAVEAGPETLHRFRQVAGAYAVLERGFGARDAAPDRGHCHRCNDIELLQTGLDGNRYCRRCMLTAQGKRALPAPPVVVVGCGFTLTGLAVSAAALVAWTSTGRLAYWWISVAACLVAMIVLATICLTVRYAVLATARVNGFARPRRRKALVSRASPPSVAHRKRCPSNR